MFTIHKSEIQFLYYSLKAKKEGKLDYQTIIIYRNFLTELGGADSNFIDFVENLCNDALYLGKGIEHVIAAIEAFGYEVLGVK